VIRLFRAVLEKLGLPVRLVTETNVPHADNIAYFGTGTDEAHMVYNFALPPLVLHAMATGNARVLTEWAEGLSTPSPQTAFLNFLASHDGIGLNPARGILSDSDIDGLVRRTLDHGGQISYKAMPDGSKVPYEMNINYLDALSDPGGGETAEQAARKFLTAQAIMLSLRGVPGIYFHSLFGSRGDPEAAQRTGIARRINRARLTSAALEAALADPGSLASRVFAGFQQLLHLRRGQAAFSPTVAQRILRLDPRVFAVLRGGEMNAAPFLCCHNVSRARVSVEWREGLSAPMDLAPYETRWLPLASQR
jgi:sucrose phosphorylase